MQNIYLVIYWKGSSEPRRILASAQFDRLPDARLALRMEGYARQSGDVRKGGLEEYFQPGGGSRASISSIGAPPRTVPRRSSGLPWGGRAAAHPLRKVLRKPTLAVKGCGAGSRAAAPPLMGLNS